MDLKPVREEIDKIDNVIKNLLVFRMGLMPTVAKIKKAKTMEVHQSGREEEMYNMMRKFAETTGIDSELIIEIYKTIITKSKEIQAQDIVESIQVSDEIIQEYERLNKILGNDIPKIINKITKVSDENLFKTALRNIPKEVRRMSFDYIRRIPTPEEIMEKIPLTEEIRKIRDERDKELKSILRSEDKRLIIIIGPCSADNAESVLDYVTRLSKVNEKVKDKLYIIPRIYTNKPRTNGVGYKGMLHQPNLDEKPNLANGIDAIRRLHIDVIKETKMTAADEMLYPENFSYLEDIIGYNAIGARSVENQGHRLVASGIDTPVGMKNPMCGDLTVMFNAINAAQIKQEFIYHNWEVKSTGNEYAHAILRGYLGAKGESIPNYHYEDLLNASRLYDKAGLKNPAIIIDTSHSNSNKNYKEQSRIAKEILFSMNNDEEIKKHVKGLMIESYIVEGKQDINQDRIYGKSVTDGCIGWGETEELLYYIADNV